MLNPANPSDFLRLAKPVIPALALLTAALLACGLYLAFFVAPPDYQQGDSVGSCICMCPPRGCRCSSMS